VFALRKWTQPIPDDIGDKSVFEFYKKPEAEQRRILAAMDGGRGPRAVAAPGESVSARADEDE